MAVIASRCRLLNFQHAVLTVHSHRRTSVSSARICQDSELSCGHVVSLPGIRWVWYPISVWRPRWCYSPRHFIAATELRQRLGFQVSHFGAVNRLRVLVSPVDGPSYFRENASACFMLQVAWSRPRPSLQTSLGLASHAFRLVSMSHVCM